MQRLVHQGVPTADAARSVTARRDAPAVDVANASIAAQVRQRHPELSTSVLAKPPLLAMSRAIEDEHAARGAGGVLVGAFQRERFYRQSQQRWTELARTARLSMVFGDFAERSDPSGGPVELPLPADALLHREWIVACYGPALTVCLAGWQRLSSGPDAPGEYETVWTPDSAVVADVLAVAADAAEGLAPDLAGRLRNYVHASPASAVPTGSGNGIVSLTNRMVAYVAKAVPAERDVPARGGH